MEYLKILKEKVDGLYSSSLENEKYLVDVPFTVEEVAVAVHRLKGMKAAGPNTLMAERLKFAEESAIIWLKNIMNGIVPLMMDSYRGITLTSVVAEVLEFLVLGRMDGLLLEAGIPHI